MKVMVFSRGYPTARYKLNGIFEFDQAKALMAAGVEVAFAAVDIRSLRRWRKWGYERKTIDGVPVYALHLPVGKMPGFVKRAVSGIGFRFLYRKITRNQQKPDVVHAHFTLQAYAAAKAKQWTGLPLVVTEHSSVILRKNAAGADKKEAAFAYQTADTVIAVSNALKDVIRDEYGVSAVCVPNMIDTDMFCPAPPSGPRGGIKAVSAGNLVPGKRHEASIRAIAAVKGEYPDLTLTIYGEGPQRDKLEQLIKSLGVEAQVSLPDQVKRGELATAFQSSDFFMLPSALETFGLVYIEAMATGLPVIATRCGGPEDFVDAAKGLLIPVDEQAALDEAVRYMAGNAPSYRKADIARQIHGRFSSQAVAKELIRVYHKLSGVQPGDSA